MELDRETSHKEAFFATFTEDNSLGCKYFDLIFNVEVRQLSVGKLLMQLIDVILQSL